MRVLFLGLDLGGSGTRAALATGSGEVVASGRGGPSAHERGLAGRRVLARALDAALAPIHGLVGQSQPLVVHAGTTGLSVPGRREVLSLELSTRFPQADVRVSNDAQIALWSGLAGCAGVAVLAGTGSIAMARSAEGAEARVGGWGYLLGDEGGGFWLGREAVAALLRAQDRGGECGVLTDLVQDSIRPASDVLAWAYATPGSTIGRVAALAPLVARAAAAGDPTAIDILERAARALADIAVAAARRVWPSEMPEGVRIACCGGVWAAGPCLSAPFGAAIAERLPGAVPGPPVLPPVAGALLLAMGADTTPLAPGGTENLRAAFKPRDTAQ